MIRKPTNLPPKPNKNLWVETSFPKDTNTRNYSHFTCEKIECSLSRQNSFNTRKSQHQLFWFISSHKCKTDLAEKWKHAIQLFFQFFLGAVLSLPEVCEQFFEMHQPKCVVLLMLPCFHRQAAVTSHHFPHKIHLYLEERENEHDKQNFCSTRNHSTVS